MLLAMDAATNVRNMATDLRYTALLDGHAVRYLASHKRPVQNLGGEFGMILQKRGHHSVLLFQYPAKRCQIHLQWLQYQV